MILTPEFLADLAHYNAGVRRAVDGYAAHPFIASCRGPRFCTTPGCPNGAKNVARKAGAA